MAAEKIKEEFAICLLRQALKCNRQSFSPVFFSVSLKRVAYIFPKYVQRGLGKIYQPVILCDKWKMSINVRLCTADQLVN